MTDNQKILDLTYEAGAILLENGAEISRVEGTMRRIAGHFGVEDESFFVLSNGIIAAGEGYARSKFIPIRGASLDKVVAVNQLSREVAAGQCTLEQIEDLGILSPADESVLGCHQSTRRLHQCCRDS